MLAGTQKIKIKVLQVPYSDESGPSLVSRGHCAKTRQPHHVQGRVHISMHYMPFCAISCLFVPFRARAGLWRKTSSQWPASS